MPGKDGIDWRYQVSMATKKQFNILKELMKREDVDCTTNACDAGREGELIFRLVYDKVGCKKPIKRLWISSMEDEAIEDGFAHLKDGADYEKLYEAALCRERADWIVGINATRLFSTLYGQTLNVGRVMTPTLGMIVGREAEIEGFRPEPFYSVQISVAGIPMSGERIKDKADAADIAQKMADGINPRKWVCVEADELTVVSKDNIIMLFMADHELYSMDDAVAAFTEVCGNPDNTCQPK